MLTYDQEVKDCEYYETETINEGKADESTNFKCIKCYDDHPYLI